MEEVTMVLNLGFGRWGEGIIPIGNEKHQEY